MFYNLHKMCYNIIDKIYRKVGVKGMKDFYSFMRHFQLINCKIVIYACKELKCLFCGESRKSKFTPETAQEYIDDLKKGVVKPLPMGPYEYNCCVEYLKMIRRELIKNKDYFRFITLTFGECDEYGLICPPLEDCLEMVAKEVGFTVVYEEVEGDKYTYTLKSSLGERG